MRASSTAAFRQAAHSSDRPLALGSGTYATAVRSGGSTGPDGSTGARRATPRGAATAHPARADRGQPAGHRLHERHPEGLLDARHHEGVAAARLRERALVLELAEE